MSQISLNDYLLGDGFGEDLEGLKKSMTAGSITGTQTLDQPLTMEPLKAESLEKTLKLLEFRTQDIKLWNVMPKLTAYNTVEEFLQLTSYGAERGGFYNEGELSEVEDSTYVRRAALVKYMQVTGSVTIQAQMVNSFVNAMKKETENKMQWLLRLANRNLVGANSDIISQEFDGLFAQHASIGVGNQYVWNSPDQYFNSDVVIDMRGKSLTQEVVEKASVSVDANYGSPDTLFAPTQVISALSQHYYQSQRILLDSSKGYQGMAGVVVKEIATTVGNISLMADKFMAKPGGLMLSDPSNNPSKAPNAPAALSVTLTADPSSRFVASDAGKCYYAVAAINNKGQSVLLASTTVVTLAPGQRVDLTITPPSGGNPVQGYYIYRTEVFTGTPTPSDLRFFPIQRVSTSMLAAGMFGGPGVIGDRGYALPNTEEAFLTQMDEDVLSFKQLAPLSKLDLAVVSMSRQFICFLFGTPQLYAPKKMVRFVNVSKKLNP